MRTVFPTRFQMEPVDVVAFDVWQDREGLEDASPACRAAWAEFRGAWRAARAVDLAKVPEAYRQEWDAHLDPWEKAGRSQAQALGAWFQLCHAVRGRKRPSARKIFVWGAWKAQMIADSPAAWMAQWALIDGEKLALVARGHELTPSQLGTQVRRGWRGLAERLQLQVVL